MRMSRERIFFLAERIMKELGNVPGVTVKAPDEVRPEIIRVLTDESKLEESVDTEVRNRTSQLYNTLAKVNYAATPEQQGQLALQLQPGSTRSPNLYGPEQTGLVPNLSPSAFACALSIRSTPAFGS